MFKIITLVENTTLSKDYHSKHGLCFYIETKKHKMLFDLGKDNLFIQNAKKMNIDITKIDTVIISHGHKDHGGALKEFMSVNPSAKIYIKKEAFEPHYIKVFGVQFSVGLDVELQHEKQIILVEKDMWIDDELFLFSNVMQEGNCLKSNKYLYRKKQGNLLLDDFCHEQSLIINSDGKNTLISGCSHTGIINIINKAEKLVSQDIISVVGGFHLYNPPTRKYESNKIIDSITTSLLEKKSIYYTCHCTGERAFKRMKNILGDRINYLSVGNVVDL